jgi:hypothetical protein
MTTAARLSEVSVSVPYSPSAKQGDIGSPFACGDDWSVLRSAESTAESSGGGLVPIHHPSPHAEARFSEMMRLASENALLERRLNEHTHSAEMARVNAAERETELEVKLEASLADMRAEHERELHKAAAASVVESAILR